MYSKHHIADLIVTLGHIDESVRNAAKAELVAIGRPAVPQLIDVLTQECWYISGYGAEFYTHIEESAIPVYMEQMANQASEILAEIGESTVPELTAELTRAEREFSEWFYKYLRPEQTDRLITMLAYVKKGE
jgi:HEAT repeat protein